MSRIGACLLPYPEPRAAQANFFDQIANDGLSGSYPEDRQQDEQFEVAQGQDASYALRS